MPIYRGNQPAGEFWGSLWEDLETDFGVMGPKSGVPRTLPAQVRQRLADTDRGQELAGEHGGVPEPRRGALAHVGERSV